MNAANQNLDTQHHATLANTPYDTTMTPLPLSQAIEGKNAPVDDSVCRQGLGNISFCACCGDYVLPVDSEMELDDMGELIVLCKTCRRMANRTLTPAQASSRSGDILP